MYQLTIKLLSLKLPLILYHIFLRNLIHQAQPLAMGRMNTMTCRNFTQWYKISRWLQFGILTCCLNLRNLTLKNRFSTDTSIQIPNSTPRRMGIDSSIRIS